MIEQVARFMQAGEQKTNDFDVRQYALYTGLQCEELAEKLRAIGITTIAEMLDMRGNELKKGDWDTDIAAADKVELVDGDADLLWVSAGAMLSMSPDPQGAWKEVVRSNMSKVNPETGRMDRNADGKIMKSKTYSKPNLAPFLPTISASEKGAS